MPGSWAAASRPTSEEISWDALAAMDETYSSIGHGAAATRTHLERSRKRCRSLLESRVEAG